VDTIVDVNAAETTITMEGDYSVTTNFEGIPRPVNWPPIGGIIGGVVVIGLLVFVFFGRRKKEDWIEPRRELRPRIPPLQQRPQARVLCEASATGLLQGQRPWQ